MRALFGMQGGEGEVFAGMRAAGCLPPHQAQRICAYGPLLFRQEITPTACKKTRTDNMPPKKTTQATPTPVGTYNMTGGGSSKKNTTKKGK